MNGMEESDDEYISLDDISGETHDFFQIQLNKTKIKIVQIGHCSQIPDIIIEKDFGKNKAFTLYNIVYSREELDESKNYIPLVKLKQKFTSVCMNYCIAIKLNGKIDNFTDFDVYFLRALAGVDDETKFFVKKIEKDIDQENMVEKLLENVIDINVEIFDKP